MAMKLVSAPAEKPIDKTYVKDKLRIDHDDDDVMVDAFIAANTAFCDGPTGFLKRALIDQTWDYYADEFPTDGGPIELPLAPLIEVVGVFYLDSAGADQEFDIGSYEVDGASEPPRVFLVGGASWPTPGEYRNVLRVRFRAGYLNTDSPPTANVPDDIKMGILLRVKADYDGGDQADKLRAAAETVLRQKRLHLSLA